VHYDVCNRVEKQIVFTDSSFEEVINSLIKCCRHFKNKAKFVELPCKVGDSVYLLQKYYGTYCFNVVEDKVQMIGVTSRGIHIKARNHHDHNKMYMLGKTVFLTKEEAEQKLRKEDKKNGI
jgi:hypothetical protein